MPVGDVSQCMWVWEVPLKSWVSRAQIILLFLGMMPKLFYISKIWENIMLHFVPWECSDIDRSDIDFIWLLLWELKIYCLREERRKFQEVIFLNFRNDIDKLMRNYLNLTQEEAMEADIPFMFITFNSAKDPTYHDRFPGGSCVSS